MDFAKILYLLLRLVSVLLIPGVYFLSRSIKNQIEIKSDLKLIKKYIGIMCNRFDPKIPCVLNAHDKEE